MTFDSSEDHSSIGSDIFENNTTQQKFEKALCSYTAMSEVDRRLILGVLSSKPKLSKDNSDRRQSILSGNKPVNPELFHPEKE